MTYSPTLYIKSPTKIYVLKKIIELVYYLGIINSDDKYAYYFKTKNTITYGIYSGDYKIEDYKLSSSKTLINMSYKDSIYKYVYPLIGKYNIYNILLTITLLNQLGINLNDIDFKGIKSPDGRMDMIKYNTNSIIIDYAHTPDAMDNIYKTVKPICKGSIITVFGCTGSREREKRPLMMKLALANSDYVIVTSDDLHEEDFNDIVKDMTNGVTNNHYEVIKDRGKAIKKGIDKLTNNDILLVLGKGHEEYIIVGNDRIPFNDHKETIKILNEMKVFK